MKKNKIIFAILVLTFAILACKIESNVTVVPTPESPTLTLTAEAAITERIGSLLVVTNCDYLYVREWPKDSSKIIDSAPNGAKLKFLGKENDWYYVEYNSKRGYVYASYIKLDK